MLELKDIVRRIYRLRGMDRVLYTTAPNWRVGTFLQTSADEGRLVLHATDVRTPQALVEARARLDQIAQRYRLAICRRVGRPITLVFERSEEPNFDPPGTMRVHGRAEFTMKATATVLPNTPPEEIEQLPEAAERWITTVAETASFGAHADEIVKRLYLVIEELQDRYRACLTDIQLEYLQEAKWVRDFVSHPTCGSQKLCAFVAQALPSAVVEGITPTVRYDRTDIEHRNFVGRYQTRVSEVANALINRALLDL